MDESSTFFSPHHCGVFVFFLAHPAARVRVRVRLRRLRRALLISHITSHTHNSSHTTHHTQLISHHSSHPQLISHTTHLSHNSSHTQLISPNSSHTTHLTQFISHTTHLTQLISHTTHLTHNSSHTQLISHTTHLTQLISQTTHLTQLISHTSSHRRVAWQAQYTELPEGAAARIVAAVAAARFCVAGAVHRASWRSCGADCRRSGRGSFLRGRRSTQSFLKELRRGSLPQWPRLLFVWQAQYTELPEGAAARRRGRGSSFLCGRRSTQSFLKELRRGLSPQWPRLPVVWQPQYTECPEGAVAAAALYVAGAVHRACWRSCGFLTELQRGLSPQWPRLPVVWQAQYTECPEGAAASIVAAVAAAGLLSLIYWRLQKRCLCDRSGLPVI